ncbi:hypothetical protein [Caballeronia grimmiae]|uniref:hypothetical protein n=1 Tax=Caballeronia grimmiae TaxID=1071679 RepID=UPI0038BAA6C0
MTYNVVPIDTTKMLRGLKKAVALASSCVVVATVAYFFAHNGAASTEESKPDGLKCSTSLSGQFQAVLLTWAGGGGISSYCNEALLVTPSPKSQQQAELESGMRCIPANAVTLRITVPLQRSSGVPMTL